MFLSLLFFSVFYLYSSTLYLFSARHSIFNVVTHQNGRVLEVTASYLQGKYGVALRIESINKDNSHSWVRISHELNKLVADLADQEYDDDEQETSETKTEFFALKTEVFAYASVQRLKQNQEDLLLFAHLQELYLFVKEFGLILNQELNLIKRTQWQSRRRWSGD